MTIRRLIAGLAGVSAATASLLAVGATSASADRFEAIDCNKYPIGQICLVRGWDASISEYYFYGRYTNTGASVHAGHIDLYANSKVVYQDFRYELYPGQHHGSTAWYEPASAKVRVDWVDENGTHFKSPQKTESTGL